MLVKPGEQIIVHPRKSGDEQAGGFYELRNDDPQQQNEDQDYRKDGQYDHYAPAGVFDEAVVAVGKINLFVAGGDNVEDVRLCEKSQKPAG